MLSKFNTAHTSFGEPGATIFTSLVHDRFERMQSKRSTFLMRPNQSQWKTDRSGKLLALATPFKQDEIVMGSPFLLPLGLAPCGVDTV